MESIVSLTHYVNKTLEYSQAFPFPLNSTNLLLQWEKAKLFIKKRILSNKLILRLDEPIEIELSEEDRRQIFNSFLSSLDRLEINNAEFRDFLLANERGFFDNRVLLPNPGKQIPLGAKLVRSFKHFFPQTSIIRTVQNLASSYIQGTKIRGYLYLSIHPMDFLTMSENNYNWSSCQSLDREYRSGVLSNMVDETTLIAYIADEKHEKLKCLPEGLTWNSKKWRMLLHTNGDVTYYSNQYPFYSSILIDKVKTWFESITNHSNVQQYKGFSVLRGVRGEEEELYYNYFNICGCGLIDSRKLIDDSSHLGYTDIIQSNHYNPIIRVDESDFGIYSIEKFVPRLQIKIGELPICPCCGKEKIVDSEDFICRDCQEFHAPYGDYYLSCYSCSCRIYPGESDHIIGEEHYCKRCYNEMLRETE